LTEPNKQQSESHVPFEGEALLLSGRMDEVQREQAAAKSRDGDYKAQQLKLQSRYTTLTALLVICSIFTGAIGLYQTGAAIRASEAAERSAKVASDSLDSNEDSFWKTWIEMKAQSRAMDRNANAAERGIARSKDALDASIEASRLDQRAWISLGFIGTNPETFHVGDKPYINVSLKNTGKTPAKHLSTLVVMTRIEKDEEPTFSYDGIEAVPYGVLPPGGNTFTSLDILKDKTTGERVALTAPLLNSLVSQGVLIVVHGKVSYEDIFTKHHWLTFCYALINLPGPATFISCRKHNDTGDGDPPN
jgi:hypothetical protein